MAIHPTILDEPYAGGNSVLDQLSTELRYELHSFLELFDEDEAAVRINRGQRIDMVYFPIDAIYSITVDLSNGDAYEVDVVGRDGMVSAEIALGAEYSSRTTLCQIAGRVARLRPDHFSAVAVRSYEFRQAVRDSARRQWFISQQTVACNYAHSAQERTARWILMTQDAIHRPYFPFRVEYLSMMLGMPAQNVLDPINRLVEQRCIRFEDQHICVLSRDALRQRSCECYGRQQISPVLTTQGLLPEI